LPTYLLYIVIPSQKRLASRYLYISFTIFFCTNSLFEPWLRPPVHTSTSLMIQFTITTELNRQYTLLPLWWFHNRFAYHINKQFIHCKLGIKRTKSMMLCTFTKILCFLCLLTLKFEAPSSWHCLTANVDLLYRVLLHLVDLLFFYNASSEKITF